MLCVFGVKFGLLEFVGNIPLDCLRYDLCHGGPLAEADGCLMAGEPSSPVNTSAGNAKSACLKRHFIGSGLALPLDDQFMIRSVCLPE